MEKIQLFSSFKFEKGLQYGEESNIKNYVTIANDPKSNLSNSFTICSSLLIKFINSENNFVSIFKVDGSHWFTLDLATTQRNLDTMKETMKIYYDDPITRKYANDIFLDIGIPIVPHSWYHICMGLDTVSGLLRIVVNGRMVVNEAKEYFKNTTSWRPNSVAGRVFGKLKAWLQSISNQSL